MNLIQGTIILVFELVLKTVSVCSINLKIIQQNNVVSYTIKTLTFQSKVWDDLYPKSWFFFDKVYNVTIYLNLKLLQGEETIFLFYFHANEFPLLNKMWNQVEKTFVTRKRPFTKSYENQSNLRRISHLIFLFCASVVAFLPCILMMQWNYCRNRYPWKQVQKLLVLQMQFLNAVI